MPVYKREGVIGYWVGEQVYHEECYEKMVETRRDHCTGVICSEDTAERIFLCDGCGKEIE
jgi:hypothetical protein